MQVVFNLLGKCDGCIHYDGAYKVTSPCGTCERNPKIKNMKDEYRKAKTVLADLKKNGPTAPADDPSRALEAENDEAGSDYGILPAAHRRAVRDVQKGDQK
jgi:hypothetical protein